MSDVKHFHLDLESESGSTFEFWVDTSSKISTWVLSVHQKGLLSVVVCHLLSLDSQMFCFCRCSHNYIQKHFQNWSYLQLFKNILTFRSWILDFLFMNHNWVLSLPSQCSLGYLQWYSLKLAPLLSTERIYIWNIHINVC